MVFPFAPFKTIPWTFSFPSWYVIHKSEITVDDLSWKASVLITSESLRGPAKLKFVLIWTFWAFAAYPPLLSGTRGVDCDEWLLLDCMKELQFFWREKAPMLIARRCSGWHRLVGCDRSPSANVKAALETEATMARSKNGRDVLEHAWRLWLSWRILPPSSMVSGEVGSWIGIGKDR